MQNSMFIKDFKGMLPAKDDALLNGSQAAFAMDVDIASGALESVPKDSDWEGVTYNFDPAGSPPPNMLFVVPGSPGGDIVIVSGVYSHCASALEISGTTRFVLAGKDAPTRIFRRERSGVGTSVLEIPYNYSPYASAPMVTVHRKDPEVSATRYAVMAMSLVYSDGAESPLSPYSEEFSYTPGDTVEIAPINIEALPVRPLLVRYYISVGSNNGVPEMKFIGENKDPQFSFPVELPNDILGEGFTDYNPFPNDVRCVCLAPWGGFAFTQDSDPGVVKFTDSIYLYRVYREFSVNVGCDIKCLAKGTNSVFVLCDDGGPFVLTGETYDAVIMSSGSKVERLFSSPSGVGVYNGVCAFVASCGIVTVSASGTVSPFTEEQMFTQKQWKSFNPESMAVAFLSDSSIIISSPGTQRSIIVKPYGVIYRSGARRAFAVSPTDNSVYYL